MLNQEFVNAIISSNTNSKTTDSGHYAEVSRDEQTGGLIYTLYKEDGTAEQTADGSPLTMSLAGFKTIIGHAGTATAGVYSKSYNELFNSTENMGATYGGDYTEYHSGKIRTALGNMTKTPNDTRRGMHTSFGSANISFFDDVTKGGKTASTYWTKMMETMTKSEIKPNELKAEGVLANVKDLDGSGGISQDEINNQWMAFSSALLSGESEFSKNAFIDFVDDQMKNAYEFGAKQKNKVSQLNNSINPFKPGAGQYIYPGDGKKKIYISSDIANKRRRNVIDIITKNTDGAVFVGELANDYTWNSKEGVWTSGQGKNKIEISTFQLMNDERPYAARQEFENGLSNIETSEDTRDVRTFDPKTNISTTYLTGTDNDVASNLNTLIPPIDDMRNKDGLEFRARGGTSSLGYQTVALYKAGGDIMKYPFNYPGEKGSGVVMINGIDMSGEPHPKGGKEIKFSTSGNRTKSERIDTLNDVIDILKTFELYANNEFKFT